MSSDRNCAMDIWAMDELMVKGEGILAAFREQPSDAEIAAVVTYDRNAWGNELGNMVQLSEIKALR